jgi:hypothetical protein
VREAKTADIGFVKKHFGNVTSGCPIQLSFEIRKFRLFNSDGGQGSRKMLPRGIRDSVDATVSPRDFPMDCDSINRSDAVG